MAKQTNKLITQFTNCQNLRINNSLQKYPNTYLWYNQVCPAYLNEFICRLVKAKEISIWPHLFYCYFGKCRDVFSGGFYDFWSLSPTTDETLVSWIAATKWDEFYFDGVFLFCYPNVSTTPLRHWFFGNVYLSAEQC